MSILQINNLGKNNIELVTDGINIKMDKKIPDVINESIIIIGPDDNGENVDIDKLIQARNNGKTIIFTHGNPSIGVEHKEEEEEDQYQIRQAEYLQKLKDKFGINGFADGFKYEFYNEVIEKKSNKKFSIQETHSTGLILSDKYEILMNNPLIADSSTNFYLAVFEEVGKGKVVFWNVGHCSYGKNDIENLTLKEKQILVNLIK
jgi:hypothetical protein